VLFTFNLGVCYSLNSNAQSNISFNSLFGKDEITVVITDSGLGGLSVMEDIAQRMKDGGYFKTAHLIFVNALFDLNTGYNAIKTRDEKIKTINNVLNAISHRYQPDVILVACNTLSVIIPETEFVKESKIPVVGIVESGVQLIKENLNNSSSSVVIIMGTETTIEEDSHRKELLRIGVANNRIITKACPQLQAYIEQNPEGEETEMLISVYLNEALEGLPKESPLYISLNCSHFGYSERLWQKVLDNAGYNHGKILNPNTKMGDIITPEKLKNRFIYPKLTLQVISQVELLNVKTMCRLFQRTSPDLADAIENYRFVPGLFNLN